SCSLNFHLSPKTLYTHRRTTPPYTTRRSSDLLCHSAYAKMVFQDVLWPDVDRRTLWAAIQEYARRDRRFAGAVDTPSACTAAAPRSKTLRGGRPAARGRVSG